MVQVMNNKILMTRGDSLRLQLDIYQTDGSKYQIQSGDSIRFAASISYADDKDNYKLVINKQIEHIVDSNVENDPGILLLSLDPEDTNKLNSGTYNYDIQITFSDGRVDTFIASTLTISPEVA